jgi:LCP family protein required for cell wall assembly
LWVISSVLADQNIQYSRLGLVFYRKEQATIGDNKAKYLAGTYAVAQTLYDNFQVAPNHYIYFEMTDFAQAIDQIGGLDVNIPSPITSGGNSFAAGPQHLTGEQALLYARILQANELSDGWNRLDRQNVILNALRAKALDPATYVQIPALVNIFWNDILTDLSPSQIQSITCMLNEVPSENIKMLEIDPGMITGPGPDSSMIPDVEKVKQFLQEQLAP